MTQIHDSVTRCCAVTSLKLYECRCVSDLNSSLGQFGPLSQLLSRVDVGVVRSLESPLQLLQLLRCEGGPTAALLPL